MKAGFSGVVALVVMVLIVALVLSLGGQMLQTTRDAEGNGTPSFVVSDSALNLTANSVRFLPTTGTIIGALIILAIVIFGLLGVLKMAQRQLGGGRGGSGGGYRGRFGG